MLVLLIIVPVWFLIGVVYFAPAMVMGAWIVRRSAVRGFANVLWGLLAAELMALFLLLPALICQAFLPDPLLVRVAEDPLGYGVIIANILFFPPSLVVLLIGYHRALRLPLQPPEKIPDEQSEGASEQGAKLIDRLPYPLFPFLYFLPVSAILGIAMDKSWSFVLVADAVAIMIGYPVGLWTLSDNHLPLGSTVGEFNKAMRKRKAAAG
jgi:hypothetical protein